MEPSCPECRGTGFRLQTGEAGVTVADPCPCGLRDRGLRLLRSARIPRRYDHCTLEQFETHHPTHVEARAIALDWIEGWPLVGNGLLFLGGPGRGKTHLAVAMARELALRKGARVLFYEQRELLKALQGTFDSSSGRSEADVLAPVVEAEVLVLDDLGAGRVTEWGRDVLHDVLTARYNASTVLSDAGNRPLLITTNRPIQREDSAEARTSLEDALGEALMSRLYEMCRIVEFGGADYRREILNAHHRPPPIHVTPEADRP